MWEGMATILLFLAKVNWLISKQSKSKTTELVQNSKMLCVIRLISERMVLQSPIWTIYPRVVAFISGLPEPVIFNISGSGFGSEQILAPALS